MFDQIATQLVKLRTRPMSTDLPVGLRPLPADWNLYDRSEFYFILGSTMLRSALASRIATAKQLIVVQDADTQRVAVFDKVADALEYFCIPNSVLNHRLKKGYCVSSRTLWKRYKGGALEFRRLPLQTDNSRPFMIFGKCLDTGAYRLFTGVDAASAALGAEYCDVRACIENNLQPTVKGWDLKIATIDNILDYFPSWEPLDFRICVAVTSDMERALATENAGGFDKEVPREPHESAATVWRRIVQQHRPTMH